MMETIIKSAYVVVLFQKDNEVAVIPNIWLQSHNQCVWPDFKTKQRNMNAVVNGLAPEQDWPTSNIKVLSSTGKLIWYHTHSTLNIQ